jgi:hypothetical protein
MEGNQIIVEETDGRLSRVDIEGHTLCIVDR